MTVVKKNKKKSKKINHLQVAEYLNQNKEFFQQYPDLLLTMDLGSQSDGTSSLVERQMKGLRNRNKELEKELQQVIRNAQDNQHLLQQTISLTLKLISCSKLKTLTQTLFQQLGKLFAIEHTNLLLEQDAFDKTTDLAVDMSVIRETLGDNFPKQQTVCGRLKEAEKAILFEDGSQVNSVAILPLGDEGELGLLVLGSIDPTHFDPEKGDLFLLLIAEMLSRLLYRFGKTDA